MLLPEPAKNTDGGQGGIEGRVGRAYVFRISKGVKQWTSILEEYFPERTIPPFLEGACRTRCCGLLPDRAE
jgi:hypothetical protein